MFRFPWGDMHSLNLGWFLQKFNELRADWATAEAGIDGALDAEIQRAEDALSDVFDARDAAAASATAAAGSASSANTSKTAAANSATAAASSATLANQKASAAGLSEAAATQSATAASNSATAAATSATQAGQSATNAAASETAAGQQATNAAGSATAAAGSASDAADSATEAAASAARAEEVEESIPEDYSTLSNNYTNKTEPTIVNSPYQVRKFTVPANTAHPRGIAIDQIFVNQREGENTRIIVRSGTNTRSYRLERTYTDGSYVWTEWTKANTNSLVTPVGKSLARISVEVPSAAGDEEFTLIVIQDPFYTDVYSKLP